MTKDKKNQIGMWKILILSGGFFLLCSCMSACGPLEFLVKGHWYYFNDTVKRYRVLLNSGSFQELSHFYVNSVGEHPNIDGEQLSEEVKVIRLNIFDELFNIEGDKNKAIIKFQIAYYLKDNGIIKQQTIQQDWWYDEQLKRWFIESDFPTFK